MIIFCCGRTKFTCNKLSKNMVIKALHIRFITRFTTDKYTKSVYKYQTAK